ncbi:hypothetical protein [Streptomyces albiflavescens]|nr:hypothetical protein [Streptomyces albiflavescens]
MSITSTEFGFKQDNGTALPFLPTAAQEFAPGRSSYGGAPYERGSP